MRYRNIVFLAGATALLSLGACGGSSPEGFEETPDPFGTITLAVTDSPVDEAAKVVVEFTGVEIKASNDEQPEVFDFDDARQIDLLALDGGGSAILLADESLPAGEYEWIRLKVNAGQDASDSYIELDDGSQHPLFIPSGNETGLKLVEGFTVDAGGGVDFTIDFDLRRSVIRPPGLGGTYLLKPALRLVNNFAVGAIEGEVAAAIVTTDCSAAVYVFEGFDASPDDVGSDAGPFSTTGVYLDDTTGAYRYRADFLPEGSYTAVLTCQAIDDEAESNEDIDFVEAKNATVAAGEAVTVDFAEVPTPPPAAGAQTVYFEIEATDFGAGAGEPIPDVTGNFTIEYDPSDLGSAMFTTFEVEAVGSTTNADWGSNFTSANVLLEVAEDSITIGGLDPVDSVAELSNDFALSFDFPSLDPASAPPLFQSFLYAVSTDNEVYEANAGEVTATKM